MNELTFSPKSPFQIYDEIDQCLQNSGDKKETEKKIHALIKEICFLKKEDINNFQNLMDLDLLRQSLLIKNFSPRLAWKFSKAVTYYPDKEIFLSTLSNNFVSQGLFDKAFKVINSNDDTRQKIISINYMLNSLLEATKREQQIPEIIMTNIEIALNNSKISDEINKKLYLKINELRKSLAQEKKSEIPEKEMDERLADAIQVNSISEVEKVKEPEKKDVFRFIEKPTLSEISEMVTVYEEDNDASPFEKFSHRITIQNNLYRLLKDDISAYDSILEFICSINDMELKSESIDDLLREFKKSVNLDIRFLYIDLLKKDKHKYPDEKFILETVGIINKRFPHLINKRENHLIALFEKINWLNEDYDCANEILNSVSYELTLNVLSARFVKRYFFLAICEVIKNTHPERVAEKKELISNMEQAESEKILKEFVQELLVADQFEMASNLDSYLHSDSGRKEILKIISAFAEKQIKINQANSKKM